MLALITLEQWEIFRWFWSDGDYNWPCWLACFISNSSEESS